MPGGGAGRGAPLRCADLEPKTIAPLLASLAADPSAANPRRKRRRRRKVRGRRAPDPLALLNHRRDQEADESLDATAIVRALIEAGDSLPLPDHPPADRTRSASAKRSSRTRTPGRVERGSRRRTRRASPTRGSAAGTLTICANR
jgi:hypothetical protein